MYAAGAPESVACLCTAVFDQPRPILLSRAPHSGAHLRGMSPAADTVLISTRGVRHRHVQHQLQSVAQQQVGDGQIGQTGDQAAVR